MLLSEERMSIVSKHEINLGDLPQLNYIKYDTDQHLKTTLDNWWIKTFDVPAHVSMEVDRIETCKEMVKKGLGFSVMPNMSLRGEDDLYTKEIKIDGQPVTRQSWLLYKSDMIDLKIVESLSHFVKQYYNLDS